MEDDIFGRVVDHWEAVIEDMAVTAEEYREAGRETVELHPGDVTTLTPTSQNPDHVRAPGGDGVEGLQSDGAMATEGNGGNEGTKGTGGNEGIEGNEGPDEYGFDVVVPGEEFDRLRALIADRQFESYEVLRAEAEGVVFAVVVLESSDGEAAAFVPVYYDASELTDLQDAAQAQGALHTRIRQLSGQEVIRFTHDEPDPFFPGDSAVDGDRSDGPAT